jgi:hypothetical protein
VLRDRPIGGKQREPSLLPARLVKRLDALQPRRTLAVIDLTEIEHMPIDHTPAREPPLLGNAPITVLIAVFDASMALQIHTPEA